MTSFISNLKSQKGGYVGEVRVDTLGRGLSVIMEMFFILTILQVQAKNSLNYTFYYMQIKDQSRKNDIKTFSNT